MGDRRGSLIVLPASYRDRDECDQDSRRNVIVQIGHAGIAGYDDDDTCECCSESATNNWVAICTVIGCILIVGFLIVGAVEGCGVFYTYGDWCVMPATTTPIGSPRYYYVWSYLFSLLLMITLVSACVMVVVGSVPQPRPSPQRMVATPMAPRRMVMYRDDGRGGYTHYV